MGPRSASRLRARAATSAGGASPRTSRAERTRDAGWAFFLLRGGIRRLREETIAPPAKEVGRTALLLVRIPARRGNLNAARLPPARLLPRRPRGSDGRVRAGGRRA